MLSASLRAFRSPRRWVAALVATPLVLATFWSAAGVPPGAPGAPGPGWLGLLLLAGVVGAAVVASYVPLQGLRPDVGCSPCAAVSGLTLVGAALVLGSYGSDVSGPLLALVLASFGLVQRLRQQPACSPRS